MSKKEVLGKAIQFEVGQELIIQLPCSGRQIIGTWDGSRLRVGSSLALLHDEGSHEKTSHHSDSPISIVDSEDEPANCSTEGFNVDSQLEQQYEEALGHISHLQQQLTDAQRQNTQLLSQNERLRQDVAAIHKTAKVEVKTRERRLARLQAENHRLQALIKKLRLENSRQLPLVAKSVIDKSSLCLSAEDALSVNRSEDTDSFGVHKQKQIIGRQFLTEITGSSPQVSADTAVLSSPCTIQNNAKSDPGGSSCAIQSAAEQNKPGTVKERTAQWSVEELTKTICSDKEFKEQSATEQNKPGTVKEKTAQWSMKELTKTVGSDKKQVTTNAVSKPRTDSGVDSSNISPKTNSRSLFDAIQTMVRNTEVSSKENHTKDKAADSAVKVKDKLLENIDHKLPARLPENVKDKAADSVRKSDLIKKTEVEEVECGVKVKPDDDENTDSVQEVFEGIKHCAELNTDHDAKIDSNQVNDPNVYKKHTPGPAAEFEGDKEKSQTNKRPFEMLESENNAQSSKRRKTAGAFRDKQADISVNKENFGLREKLSKIRAKSSSNQNGYTERERLGAYIQMSRRQHLVQCIVSKNQKKVWNNYLENRDKYRLMKGDDSDMCEDATEKQVDKEHSTEASKIWLPDINITSKIPAVEENDTFEDQSNIDVQNNELDIITEQKDMPLQNETDLKAPVQSTSWTPAYYSHNTEPPTVEIPISPCKKIKRLSKAQKKEKRRQTELRAQEASFIAPDMQAPPEAYSSAGQIMSLLKRDFAVLPPPSVAEPSHQGLNPQPQEHKAFDLNSVDPLVLANAIKATSNPLVSSPLLALATTVPSQYHTEKIAPTEHLQLDPTQMSQKGLPVASNPHQNTGDHCRLYVRAGWKLIEIHGTNENRRFHRSRELDGHLLEVKWHRPDPRLFHKKWQKEKQPIVNVAEWFRPDPRVQRKAGSDNMSDPTRLDKEHTEKDALECKKHTNQTHVTKTEKHVGAVECRGISRNRPESSKVGQQLYTDSNQQKEGLDIDSTSMGETSVNKTTKAIVDYLLSCPKLDIPSNVSPKDHLKKTEQIVTSDITEHDTPAKRKDPLFTLNQSEKEKSSENSEEGNLSAFLNDASNKDKTETMDQENPDFEFVKPSDFLRDTKSPTKKVQMSTPKPSPCKSNQDDLYDLAVNGDVNKSLMPSFADTHDDSSMWSLYSADPPASPKQEDNVLDETVDMSEKVSVPVFDESANFSELPKATHEGLTINTESDDYDDDNNDDLLKLDLYLSDTEDTPNILQRNKSPVVPSQPFAELHVAFQKKESSFDMENKERTKHKQLEENLDEAQIEKCQKIESKQSCTITNKENLSDVKPTKYQTSMSSTDEEKTLQNMAEVEVLQLQPEECTDNEACDILEVDLSKKETDENSTDKEKELDVCGITLDSSFDSCTEKDLAAENYQLEKVDSFTENKDCAEDELMLVQDDTAHGTTEKNLIDDLEDKPQTATEDKSNDNMGSTTTDEQNIRKEIKNYDESQGDEGSSDEEVLVITNTDYVHSDPNKPETTNQIPCSPGLQIVTSCEKDIVLVNEAPLVTDFSANSFTDSEEDSNCSVSSSSDTKSSPFGCKGLNLGSSPKDCAFKFNNRQEKNPDFSVTSSILSPKKQLLSLKSPVKFHKDEDSLNSAMCDIELHPPDTDLCLVAPTPCEDSCVAQDVNMPLIQPSAVPVEEENGEKDIHGNEETATDGENIVGDSAEEGEITSDDDDEVINGTESKSSAILDMSVQNRLLEHSGHLRSEKRSSRKETSHKRDHERRGKSRERCSERKRSEGKSSKSSRRGKYSPCRDRYKNKDTTERPKDTNINSRSLDKPRREREPKLDDRDRNNDRRLSGSPEKFKREKNRERKEEGRKQEEHLSRSPEKLSRWKESPRNRSRKGSRSPDRSRRDREVTSKRKQSDNERKYSRSPEKPRKDRDVEGRKHDKRSPKVSGSQDDSKIRERESSKHDYKSSRSPEKPSRDKSNLKEKQREAYKKSKSPDKSRRQQSPVSCSPVRTPLSDRNKRSPLSTKERERTTATKSYHVSSKEAQSSGSLKETRDSHHEKEYKSSRKTDKDSKIKSSESHRKDSDHGHTRKDKERESYNSHSKRRRSSEARTSESDCPRSPLAYKERGESCDNSLARNTSANRNQDSSRRKERASSSDAKRSRRD